MSNRVTGPYRAIVDGKETALAGCSHSCERACIRRDEMLRKDRSLYAPHGDFCGSFIPAPARTGETA